MTKYRQAVCDGDSSGLPYKRINWRVIKPSIIKNKSNRPAIVHGQLQGKFMEKAVACLMAVRLCRCGELLGNGFEVDGVALLVVVRKEVLTPIGGVIKVGIAIHVGAHTVTRTLRKGAIVLCVVIVVGCHHEKTCVRTIGEKTHGACPQAYFGFDQFVDVIHCVCLKGISSVCKNTNSFLSCVGSFLPKMVCLCINCMDMRGLYGRKRFFVLYSVQIGLDLVTLHTTNDASAERPKTYGDWLCKDSENQQI